MGAADSNLFGNPAGILGEGGGCCDYRDYPTVTEKKPKGHAPDPNRPTALVGKPGNVKGHNDEELEILVRERIRQSSSKNYNQTRFAFTDPAIDPSFTLNANSPQTPPFETVTPSIPLFGSFQPQKNWKITVGISSAANLPKSDILGNLSDIACCASIFRSDVVSNVISLGKVVHSIDGAHGHNEGSAVFHISPQFRSKKKEILVPRDLINPCWDETFTSSECHKDVEYAGSTWRTRRPANNDGSGPCILFVSIHDTQANPGDSGVIGEVWIPLRPGAGVVDSWYPLQRTNGEVVTGHGGGDSSINLRTSFSVTG